MKFIDSKVQKKLPDESAKNYAENNLAERNRNEFKNPVRRYRRKENRKTEKEEKEGSEITQQRKKRCLVQ